MGYVVNGEELESGEDEFLLEANLSDDVPPVIAAAENPPIVLTDMHWQVIRFMRERYQEDGHTPNFRNMVAMLDEEDDSVDWKKKLYELFPSQPNRQAARVAGLPKPFGKGGY
jgi:tRNA 2-thiouridine synthesizing protein E